MKAFTNKHTGQPESIHYPRNNSAEEGYQWFVKNEKMQNGKPIYGYSLPAIGQMLEKTN
jgi:hypothetical protein